MLLVRKPVLAHLLLLLVEAATVPLLYGPEKPVELVTAALLTATLDSAAALEAAASVATAEVLAAALEAAAAVSVAY